MKTFPEKEQNYPKNTNISFRTIRTFCKMLVGAIRKCHRFKVGKNRCSIDVFFVPFFCFFKKARHSDGRTVLKNEFEVTHFRWFSSRKVSSQLTESLRIVATRGSNNVNNFLEPFCSVQLIFCRYSINGLLGAINGQFIFFVLEKQSNFNCCFP